jgi:hypothetical protein
MFAEVSMIVKHECLQIISQNSYTKEMTDKSKKISIGKERLGYKQ